MNCEGVIHSMENVRLRRLLFSFIILMTTLTVNHITKAQSVTCPATKAQGDANCDGKADLIDFERWRREYTKADTTTDADFNAVEGVDLVDYELWRRTYTQSGSTTPSVTQGVTPTITTGVTVTPTITVSPTPVVTNTPTPTIQTGTKSIFWIGDSLSEQMDAWNTGRLARTLTTSKCSAITSQQGGRTTYSTYANANSAYELLQTSAFKTNVAKSNTIVIMLGANDSPEPFMQGVPMVINQIKALNASATIVWVTPTYNPSMPEFDYIGQMRDYIVASGPSLGLSVIDFHAEQRSKPSTYPFRDYVHFSENADQAMLTYFTAQLGCN